MARHRRRPVQRQSDIHGLFELRQSPDREVPAIDFAGAGRTVPWATGYRTPRNGFEDKNIFASRFNNNVMPTSGKWIFGGQGLGTGGDDAGSLPQHPHQSGCGEPVGRRRRDGGPEHNPGPWVTWQEPPSTAQAPGLQDQIFTVTAGPAATDWASSRRSV